MEHRNAQSSITTHGYYSRAWGLECIIVISGVWKIRKTRIKLYILSLVALWLWVTGFVLLDWLFNMRQYVQMEAHMWLFQWIDGSVIYFSYWHAYLLVVFQLHVALVLSLAGFMHARVYEKLIKGSEYTHTS